MSKKVKTGKKQTKIVKIHKLEYIADILCWCGEKITIDSSKPTEENMCSCGSFHKLLDMEWTNEEMERLVKLTEQEQK